MKINYSPLRLCDPLIILCFHRLLSVIGVKSGKVCGVGEVTAGQRKQEEECDGRETAEEPYERVGRATQHTTRQPA